MGVNMLQTITSKLHEWYNLIYQKIQKVDTSTDYAIALSISFLIGYAVGLLIKYLGKFVLLAVVLSALVMYGLQSFGILSFNATQITELLGLVGPITIQDVVGLVITWIKGHITQTIAAGIGLFIAFEWS